MSLWVVNSEVKARVTFVHIWHPNIRCWFEWEAQMLVTRFFRLQSRTLTDNCPLGPCLATLRG